MSSFFTGDQYHTPSDIKPFLREKILLGNTKGFYRDYASRILWAARNARRGTLNYQNYCQVSHWILSDIERHRGVFHVKGRDNFLKEKEPFVLVANHMSVLETQAMASLLHPKKIAFVVKESLMDHRIFGPIMRAVYPIPVGRKNPIEDMKVVLAKGKEYLDQGISVVVFPEGTRRSYFNPREFNSIGIKLAAHAAVKIMPLALKTDYWANGKALKDFGRISRDKEIFFEFGEAMTLEGRGKAQHKEILQFLEDRLSSWGVPVDKL